MSVWECREKKVEVVFQDPWTPRAPDEAETKDHLRTLIHRKAHRPPYFFHWRAVARQPYENSSRFAEAGLQRTGPLCRLLQFSEHTCLTSWTPCVPNSDENTTVGTRRVSGHCMSHMIRGARC